MKSFRKIIPADHTQAVRPAWQPEELSTNSGSAKAMDIAAILDIFRSAAGELNGGPVVKALAWEPAELQTLARVDEPAWSFHAAGGEAIDAFERDAVGSAGEIRLADVEKEAEEILAQARVQQAEILIQAQRSVDEMIADAQAEIEAGMQSAREQGLAEAQAEASSYLQAAQALVHEVNVWKEEVMAQSTPLVIEMICALAEKMFGEGVKLSDTALQQNLNRVLMNVKSLGDILIYLNPRDAAELDSGWREMRAATTGSRIQIIPSSNITPGGCFVEGQMGSVDARVETQLQVVLNTLAEVPIGEEQPV